MKKAAFITIHIGLNFGSILQTIATSEMLKKMGYEPICVNYLPPRVLFKRYWKEAFESPIKLLRRLLFFPVLAYAEPHYYKYLYRYCKISKPIYAESDFASCCPKADVYVTGSDQVWNYKHNEGLDKHYFFDGIVGKKVAYASSIGMVSLPEEYSLYMRNQLKQYANISVRESSAVTLLNGMGIDATQVIDPTFMLDKAKWKTFTSKRLVTEPYLFVYTPYNIKDKDLIYRTVRKISNNKRLKVIAYSHTCLKDRFADKTIRFANAGDILSLFYYADFIVTNSFHGTAFSINLNKQFWTYMPSNFTTRISSILELCGLENRLLETEISESQIDEIVKFDQVNVVLQNEREKSYEFLKKALK